MEQNEPNCRLLARYMSGECSRAENEVVEEWIGGNRERQQFMKDIDNIWRVAGTSSGAKNAFVEHLEEDWERLKTRMETAEPNASADRAREVGNERKNAPQGTSVSAVRRVFRAAAVVVLFVGAVVLAAHYLGVGSSSSAEVARFQQIVTEPGQRASVRLGDGTRVRLNVDSRLRVPNSFGTEKREVHLAGEAYFEVMSNEDRPFIIHSADAVVRVHGTRFGVRAYPDEEPQVVVQEGAVSMWSAEGPQERAVRLTSGQMGCLVADSSRVTVRQVDDSDYLNWRRGRLVFKRTPLPEVVTTLERWYDVEGELRDDSLHDLRLTADLKGNSLREVLEVVSLSLNIEYEIEGRTVVFSRTKSGVKKNAHLM